MAQSPSSATKTARLVSAAASTNATVAKAANGTLRRITGYNARGSAVYLRLYDTATAPTVGTTAPRKTIYLPTATAFHLDFDDYFGQGISYSLTTGSADNDTGAVSSGDILALNIDYL